MRHHLGHAVARYVEMLCSLTPAHSFRAGQTDLHNDGPGAEPSKERFRIDERKPEGDQQSEKADQFRWAVVPPALHCTPGTILRLFAQVGCLQKMHELRQPRWAEIDADAILGYGNEFFKCLAGLSDRQNSFGIIAYSKEAVLKRIMHLPVGTAFNSSRVRNDLQICLLHSPSHCRAVAIGLRIPIMRLLGSLGGTR
ncbi:hypothetical protein [Hoeflea sp.]|uniref:hypothetical protein n=1 Tax=Hoeflea sp. TaxID=1940281 RepID=UPI0037478500